MRKMKRIFTLIISGLLLSSVNLVAQVDEARMDKDLRVASKVLESLMQGDENGYAFYGSSNIEANYVDGYGVIFTIGGGYSFYTGRGTARAYTYGSSGGAVVVAPKSPSKEAKEGQEEQEIQEVDMSEMMVEFLVDYSQMINQLKANDKIMVSTKKSDFENRGVK